MENPEEPRRAVLLAGLLAALAVAAPAARSQEAQPPPADEAAMMQAWAAAMTPGPAHEILAQRAGDWSLTMTLFGPPGTPPEVSHGRVERRLDLGGRILVDRLTSEMMGQPLTGIAMTGHDNVTGRVWSTWTDTMSTAVSVLWGEMDASGGQLSGDYSDPMTGERSQMRIETTMDGPNRQVDRFFMVGPDGSEVQSMEVVYERQ